MCKCNTFATVFIYNLPNLHNSVLGETLLDFYIIKGLNTSSIVLFDNLDEQKAYRILHSLIDQHAEMLLLHNPELTQEHALSESESMFKLIKKSTIEKKRSQ